jgi:hypothetical protein
MERNDAARRAARQEKNEEFKRRLKPRLLWNSKAQGTYIRAQHGPLPGHK